MCSVPMGDWPNSIAACRVLTTSSRAAGVKRSNISVPPRVLLVDGLAAHAEGVGDLLPGPVLVACIGHLQMLEAFEQAAQGHDGAQADPGVGAARGGGQIGCLGHAVNVR